jgi:hypothetical protein
MGYAAAATGWRLKHSSIWHRSKRIRRSAQSGLRKTLERRE